MRFKDLTGMRFGRLMVVGLADRSNTGRIRWECKCDCGNVSKVLTHCLVSGRIVSCGCYQREKVGDMSRTHGQYKTRLHRIWNNMLQRCGNPKNDSYSTYGAKGIAVCDEWKDFENFYEWAMSSGYADNLSIDRIDNSKGYSPDNCHWATPQEQTDNRQCSRYVSHNGKTQTIKAWAKETGIPYQTLLNRFDKGWSVEVALTK